MKILYSCNFNYATKADLDVLDQLKDHGYQFAIIDWAEELEIDYNPTIEEIDKLYLEKDNNLFLLYDKIRELTKKNKIFITTQTNIYHPNFINSLKGIYKVYYSGDDPDESERCSKPYIKCFDHIFGASVSYDENTKLKDKFIEWGAKNADWWPLGFREDSYSPELTVEDIFNKEREYDLGYVGNIIKRRNMLIKLIKKFPQFKIYSNDLRNLKMKILLNTYYSLMSQKFIWIKKLPHLQLPDFYQNLKIGINEHPMFGPSTIRTYQLPANDVMQICDCPEGLNDVFKVGKEVVLYHTFDEAIELIDYYLDNDAERKEIAAAGYLKAIKDYNKFNTFLNALDAIKKGMKNSKVK